MANRMLAGGLLLLLGYWPVRANDPEVLHIGFVDSILDETAPSRRKVFAKEFGDLVRDFTGLKSVITKGLNPAIAAKQLDDEKWHLGVFHGVEFAWIIGQASPPAPAHDRHDARCPGTGGAGGEKGQQFQRVRRPERPEHLDAGIHPLPALYR